MTTRTIESSFEELKQLKDQTKEIGIFLQWKELSSIDYDTEYKKIQNQLINIRNKVNEIVEYFNEEREKWNVSQTQIKAIDWLLPSFIELRTWFEWLIKPVDFKKKLQEKQPIDLWSLSPKSTFNDISLNPEELGKLKPEKLLAKTNWWIEYYQINFNWQTTILRYNSNDSWDEVALYINVSLQWASKEDIKRIITNGERQWFQDVEMDGTWDLTTVWLAATAWWIAWGKFWVWFWSAFNPGLWTFIWWAVWWVWWAIIAWISTALDKNYTSEDYKNDFWSELEKIRNEINTMNYKH